MQLYMQDMILNDETIITFFKNILIITEAKNCALNFQISNSLIFIIG